ncbi:LLM class flavin-dependent oxidoreductase [Nocardioides alkalitolerans]|uniref:LLM class flavin-dependent oxidoreductase n=1 Tax=Nocardioides alkalitolerans TaxID=281714 RepID=UPI001B7F92A5|nr:LLM class flavin-dependent oxidoreductase [Nocardioides alkalitolerans]
MAYNFFIMDTPSHISHGMWRHPESRAVEYNDLEFWIELAQLAERHHFDSIFIADNFGMYSPINGSTDVFLEKALQIPNSEPSMLLSAMAAATRNLGFVYTSSVLQQHPFPFARQMSTLDHLTKGRIGWNMVSSFSENGFRSMGLDGLVDHDERYRWLAEYAEVVYKLWEGSWADGAVLKDKEAGIYSNPRQVRRINHVGARYRVEGPHLAEPSPQRTPVLFQAGASPAGMDFAARNAEGLFLISGSPEASASQVSKVKALATSYGRDAERIHFMEGLTFVVGSTEEEAQRKADELDEWTDVTAQMAVASGAAGVDLTKFAPDEPLVNVAEQIQGIRAGFIKMAIENAPAGTTPTLADFGRDQVRQWRITGTPETIADQIERYASAGVTGFNVMSITVPGSFTDFAEHVTPVLKERGLMQREYRDGTLREKLFPGAGPLLGETHPASGYRENDEYVGV